MAGATPTGILSRFANMNNYLGGQSSANGGYGAAQEPTFDDQAEILAQAKAAAQQRLQAQHAQMMQFAQAPAPQIAWQMPPSTALQPMRPMTPFRGGLS